MAGLLSCTQAPPKTYTPKDPELHAEIMHLDSIFFTAYNNCDLEVQARLLSDDLEFYHDQGGLSTSKEEIIKSLESNICGKVSRHLLAGSVEVYRINGVGAVQMGMHRFENKEEPDAESRPSKFVHLWREYPDGYKLSRIISLHN